MKAVLNNSLESNDATRTLPRTRRIVIFGGFGDVGQTKLVPAVREMAHFHGIPFEILIADTNTKHQDTLRQDVLYREYSVNLGRCGPVVTRIAELGFADSDVTAILATPTSTHSAIAMQIAPHVGKLLIEKPVSHCSREAQEIARLHNAVPFSHFLAKPEVSEAVMKAPQFENVTGIEMWFLETKGCGERRIDSAEVDLGYHKFAILKAMYPEAEIRIDSCRTATCPEAFTRAELQVPTAAKISGHLCQQGNAVSFRFMMGKASLEKRQYIRIICKDGTQFNYSLEGGPSPWTAHRMILEKHLLQCRGFAELSPFAHAEVVRLCEEASSLAVQSGPYRFGELAHFRL